MSPLQQADTDFSFNMQQVHCKCFGALSAFAVTCSLTDPLPGWVDNFNGPIGITAAGYKGIIRVWPYGNTFLNTIPVDVAIKLLLLASWLKGIGKPLRLVIEQSK